MEFIFVYFWFQTNHKKLPIENTSILYQTILKYPKFNLFLLSAFIFVGLSGAAFAASRASQGLEQAFASRYKTVSLILFEGEQHGFRISENIRKAYDSELYFYSKIFNFQLNEENIEPIKIENL